ncbi:DNA-binding response regulator [Cohnella pontilimi]|uniref:DNA-binding response regulator n=1 Tax=Cohnella pontilimi TaxID=2564100 RepID=A0A4U0F7Z0_9BACL|nr:DNA-binding response regulator [Cohnella pontilimi]TJY40826.1 DNA-binding response regulator [Cohnella pontilimi]
MVVDVRFEKEHREWLEKELKSLKGEARRRFLKAHGHAEKAFAERVWFPAFGHFEYLHPEYEVWDYFGGRRYLDFAYIRAGLFIAIEVDPFGTHYEKLDKRQFSDQWVRQMHLFNDSWQFIRLSYYDVMERPRIWQQLLQQMVGRLFGDNQTYELNAFERDIYRKALMLNRPIKLPDIQQLLDCVYVTARKHVTSLENKGWLVPEGKGEERTHSWTVDPTRRLPPL